jgi:hypothetical protein
MPGESLVILPLEARRRVGVEAAQVRRIRDHDVASLHELSGRAPVSVKGNGTNTPDADAIPRPGRKRPRPRQPSGVGRHVTAPARLTRQSPLKDMAESHRNRAASFARSRQGSRA